MWTVVYIARSIAEAEHLRDTLTKGGFLVKLRHVGPLQDGDGSSVEILVPSGEVEEALDTIDNL